MSIYFICSQLTAGLYQMHRVWRLHYGWLDNSLYIVYTWMRRIARRIAKVMLTNWNHDDDDDDDDEDDNVSFL